MRKSLVLLLGAAILVLVMLRMSGRAMPDWLTRLKGWQKSICVFRAKSDSDSNLIRTLNPIHFGQGFRSKSDTDSDLNSDTFSGVPERCPKWIGLFTRRTGATLDNSAPSRLFHNEKGKPWHDNPYPCVKSKKYFDSSFNISFPSGRSLAAVRCPPALWAITSSERRRPV